MSFAEKLKEILNKKQMKQREFSVCSGVSEVSISRYMKGVSVPDISTVIAICKALNVSADCLLELNTTGTKIIVWNKNKNNTPKKKGWYLCKIYEIETYDEDNEVCKWGEPYYNAVWFDKWWDCDGVPVAWAEIPECSFTLEG